MKRLVVVIGCVFLLGLTPTLAQDTPQYEATDCPAEARLPAAFHCGYVTVPADRRPDVEVDSGNLRLMVAVYHAEKSTQPDPLIYLNGGPGGSSVILGRGIMRVFGNFTDRDIVLFDQRGTGYSEPDMTCPEILDAYYDGMDKDLSRDDMDAASIEATRACHDRMVADGINPAFFNSTASAADVQDIRKALGYDQINLYGVSYGTRLALTIMRDHPEGVRSVILDSVYPPNVDGYMDGVSKVQGIFDQVFAACAASEICNTKYPDLKKVFYEVVDQLNAQPVTVKLPPHTLHVDGYLLIQGLYSWLYNAAMIPNVPSLIYQLRDGNSSGLSQFSRLLLPAIPSGVGMGYAVQCHEEYPFTAASRLEDILTSLQPVMQDVMRRDMVANEKICDLWNSGAPDSIENDAVQSDIPTLVLAGEFDPITPISYAQLAASTLSHSYQIELPVTGHGVLESNVGSCVVVATQAFLNDPAQTPPATCPAAMPIQFD
jgi:pimeloyl-ACP methyl ester carboxylesterase